MVNARPVNYSKQLREERRTIRAGGWRRPHPPRTEQTGGVVGVEARLLPTLPVGGARTHGSIYFMKRGITSEF